MIANPDKPTPFPTAKAAGTLVGATVAGGAIAAAAAWGFGQVGQIVTIVAAAGVCLVAALAALEPVRRASHAGTDRVPLAALAGIAIRLAVTLVGAALLIYAAGFESRSTAMWTLGFYLLLLLVEVRVLVRYFQTLPFAGSAQAAPTPTVEGH